MRQIAALPRSCNARVVRAAASIVIAGSLSACGSSGDATGMNTHPSSQAITFSAETLVVAPGQRAEYSASIGSGGGVSLATLAFVSSNPGVVQIAANGDVLAIAPGSATITATTGSAKGSFFVRVADSVQPSDFRPPLAQSVSVSTLFDHDLPVGFSDDNTYTLSFWGEHLASADLGHNGYDWPTPVGTPVLASAPGAVVFAQMESPLVCPLLNNAVVAGNWVTVAHGMSDGSAMETEYGHLSRIDVVFGQRVETGQQIGLSGNTGCSTGPHLHFSMFRGSPADSKPPIVVDPFGWQGPGTDPWAADPRGTTSTPIWTTASVPIYRELKLAGVFAAPSPVVMTLVHYMGVDDEHNPNNEFIDIAANPSFGDADLTGIALRDASGAVHPLPDGFHLASGATARVFSGVGTNTATTIYLGSSTPLWNDDSDCPELVRGATVLFNSFWGGSVCLGLGAMGSFGAPPAPRDVDQALPRFVVRPVQPRQPRHPRE